jgi:hypothetical protein
MFKKIFKTKHNNFVEANNKQDNSLKDEHSHETIYEPLLYSSFPEILAEQYLEEHYGLKFEKLNPDIVFNILALTANSAQLEKYLHVLTKNAEKYLQTNSPYDPSGFTTIYDMDDFYRFIARPLFANRNTPTSILETVYSHIDFNKYSSMKAAKTYLFIASNHNTPQHILKTLCFEQGNLHRNPQIILALTQNSNIPYEWLTNDLFLKKIVYHTEHIVNNIINHKDFDIEDVKRIIYGDYHENLIVEFAGTKYATREDKIYVSLKFGK